ncbi:3-keto-5-aminohexanoate cleavage protein [Ancylobacter sp. IITR112]|uniref:3-keto-5-aminohexanoate cleavage protein n=1 Tax=Ancylobacter sp. IITR112 TaxID=3138073 RepID=UPI00352B61A7
MSTPSTARPVPTGKVIITCACTGAIHTPTMSPYLPITPEQITADAIGAAEAGAAILHLHARNPENGRPDQTPEAFARFLPQVKQGTNAVINITSGGSPYMKVEERVLPAATFKPEVASLNMGSINFGLYHLVQKYDSFKFDWEKPHLEATKDLVFRNSFKDIEYILDTCYGNGTRFEFECYDIAHLYNLAHFADRGLVKAPFFVQSVFGLLGGIGTHPEDVMHMKRTADRLFGADYRWSVLGAGASQLRIATQSAAMGGNIRVGLEDSLWAGKGKLATSSADQVRMARKVIEGLGLEVATPDEARAMLQLKGGDQVNF